MLSEVGARSKARELLELARSMPDVGRFALPSVEVIATLDVILPMTVDAGDFGHIAVVHALNDVFAAFGRPYMALSLLGLPTGLNPSSSQVVEMLSAAGDELHRSGVALVGGHTLSKQSDLFLGFAIVGCPLAPLEGANRSLQSGDPIVLTKCLGTSVATGVWKTDPAREGDFSDVLAGMKQSSQVFSNAAHACGISSATDVSGFGLTNHLHLLLRRVKRRGRIQLSLLPVYESVRAESGDLPVTSQYYHNLGFADAISNSSQFTDHSRMPLAMDAQVAGGLVFICPRELLAPLRDTVAGQGLAIHVIGECLDGDDGHVEIVE